MGQRKLYLPNVIFMSVAHVIGLVGFLALVLGHWPWKTVVLGFVMYCVSGLGITVGYHRYFTHRSFKCGTVLEWVLAVCGTMAVQNSIQSWVSDHVRHHEHTDEEDDPYNAKKGFWHSHIGWIAYKIPNKNPDYSTAAHLFKNSRTAHLVRFQHKYYYMLATSFSGCVPLLVAATWGDPVGGIVFAGFSRLILVWHMTFCINSLAHTKHWGSSQPYSRRNSAQDSWIVSLVTFGEGYHNYHHAFPGDYRNGHHWYNFDPSKWLIFLLSRVGVTHGLNRVPDKKILTAQRDMLLAR